MEIGEFGEIGVSGFGVSVTWAIGEPGMWEIGVSGFGVSMTWDIGVSVTWEFGVLVGLAYE